MHATHAQRFSAAAAIIACAAGASAQTTSFIQIFNGNVSSSASVTVQSGDQVAAVVGGQAFTTTVNASGQYQTLTVTRTANDGATVAFELRRGTNRWALVPTSGATQQITVAFNGQSNPLSAAFAAQTINGFVGPVLSGNGGNGGNGGGGNGGNGNTDGDRADIDADGQITSQDALIVMSYITGDRAGVRNPAALDVNGDGRINTNDVIAILRRVGQAAVTGAAAPFQQTPGAQ